MSWSVVKVWDNRVRKGGVKLLHNGKSWTRRIQWLAGYGSQQDHVKLKFEDGATYHEVVTSQAMAEIIWSRFKEGQPIEDSVSILGKKPNQSQQSRKMAQQEGE